MKDDNVIQFPEKDRYLECIHTAMIGIREQGEKSEDCYYQLMFMGMLEEYYEEFEEGMETFMIRQKLKETMLIISHFYQD